MTVTQILPVNKTRSRVFIDDEPAFVLYKGELFQYGITEGSELSHTVYGTIIGQVLPKRAKLRAMNLLKKKEYTTEELRKKLKEGGYPEKIIEEAIAYVASYGYLDDSRYAEQYIRTYEDSKSRMMIEQNLQKKGISKTIVRQAWDAWEAEGGSADEEKMIRELLRKRRYDPETADRKEMQKNYAFLLRKGFSCDKIRSVLGNPDAEDSF